VFPRNFAFARGGEETQPVRRFFYTERGRHYLLAGVPYPWLQSAPKGELVLDPTVSMDATQDVWLQDTLNLARLRHSF